MNTKLTIDRIEAWIKNCKASQEDVSNKTLKRLINTFEAEINNLKEDTMQVKNLILKFPCDVIEIIHAGSVNIYYRQWVDKHNDLYRTICSRYGEYTPTKIEQNGRILTLTLGSD